MKKIDYCKTIEFDTGSFNYPAIMQASSNSEYRYKSAPIQYKGIKDTFILTSEANPTGGANYLTWDEATKMYGYDKDELKAPKMKSILLRRKKLRLTAAEVISRLMPMALSLPLRESTGPKPGITGEKRRPMSQKTSRMWHLKRPNLPVTSAFPDKESPHDYQPSVFER